MVIARLRPSRPACGLLLPSAAQCAFSLDAMAREKVKRRQIAIAPSTRRAARNNLLPQRALHYSSWDALAPGLRFASPALVVLVATQAGADWLAERRNEPVTIDHGSLEPERGWGGATGIKPLQRNRCYGSRSESMLPHSWT